MSSKPKPNSVKGDGEPGLVPKLRFPAFSAHGPWKRTSLANTCDRIIDKVGDMVLTPVSITAGRGFVAQAEKFGRDISGAQYKNYIHIRRGDFAYNKGNSNLYPQGCVYRLKEFDAAAASNAFICFRLRDGFSPGYFESLFQRNEHGRQLIRFLTSGARSDGLLNIKPDEFFSVEFPIPPQLAEQERIADCLTLLDDLVAAHGRKMDSLRAHRRGLLRDLIPSDGETVPTRRFPRFRRRGAWRPECVDSVAEVTTGDKDTQDKDDDGLFPFFVRSQEIQRINSYSYDGEAVLTSGDGVGVGHDFHYVNGRFDFHQRVYCLYNFRSDVSARFFYLYFAERFGARVRRMSAKNSVDSVRRAMITEMPVAMPELDEQNVIADTVFELDRMITAQSALISGLAVFRRALAQRLFPSAAEVQT